VTGRPLFGELLLRIIAAFAILLLLPFSGWPETPKSSKSSKSSSRKGKTARSKSAAASKSSAGQATAGKSSSSRRRLAGKKGSKGSKTVRETWRNRQLAPTTERYREIQQALIDKGYSSEPASGVWGPQWADALKRFQRSQNLEPAGKLDSLSLIALGLGPKRDANATPGLSSPKPSGEHP
jgi:peptidoglycan hydrolase-like protein with peptidoglycan-binding domain